MDGYADGATATGIGGLSDKLIAVARLILGNCPKGTASLGLTLKRDEKRVVECYGRSGKQIEVVPNDTTQPLSSPILEGAF